MADKNKFTILGAGTSFSGKIDVPGSIRIDGSFQGEIVCGELLVVGEAGSVEATIKTKSLEIVGGTVKGTVECAQNIELSKKARIEGNVTAKELVIDKGCIFHGNSMMLDKKGKPVAEPIAKVAKDEKPKAKEKSAEAELELEELK